MIFAFDDYRRIKMLDENLSVTTVIVLFWWYFSLPSSVLGSCRCHWVFFFHITNFVVSLIFFCQDMFLDKCLPLRIALNLQKYVHLFIPHTYLIFLKSTLVFSLKYYCSWVLQQHRVTLFLLCLGKLQLSLIPNPKTLIMETWDSLL